MDLTFRYLGHGVVKWIDEATAASIYDTYCRSIYFKRKEDIEKKIVRYERGWIFESESESENEGRYILIVHSFSFHEGEPEIEYRIIPHELVFEQKIKEVEDVIKITIYKAPYRTLTKTIKTDIILEATSNLESIFERNI